MIANLKKHQLEIAIWMKSLTMFSVASHLLHPYKSNLAHINMCVHTQYSFGFLLVFFMGVRKSTLFPKGSDATDCLFGSNCLDSLR